MCIYIYIYIYKVHIYNNFNVTVGSFDSAQIANLAGIYILDTLGKYFI